MEEQKVTVSRRGAERLAAGHLWIYRADVERLPAAEAGDVVAVVDGRGRFLAKAFWSSRSKIALRIVTRDEVPVDEAFFADRIAQAVDLRRRAFGDERFVRIVHGEADLVPGLVVDRYGDAAVLQTLVPATGGSRSSPSSSPLRSTCAPSSSGTTSASGSSRGSSR
jgi:23S rRNA (cytosine1962-C5)-methyltransferase